MGMGCKGLFYCVGGGLSLTMLLGIGPTTAFLLRHIPMPDLHFVSRFMQAFADVLCDHHRPVLPAGAAKGDGEITLALIDVMG
jgi:hypothetical protein